MTRVGGLYTYTGQLFYPLDPRVGEVRLLDVIQGLTLKCRWSSQCKVFYSVAEHSIRVANVARVLAAEDGVDGDALTKVYQHGMLHDAHEAYIVDMPSPIKAHIPGWKDMEKNIQKVILEYFGLEGDGEPYVKRADNMLLAIEGRELFDKPLSMELIFKTATSAPWPTYPAIPEKALAAAALPHGSEILYDVLQVMTDESYARGDWR